MAALFQPPKSSSGAILGVAGTAPPPPKPEVDDGLPPHAKSLVFAGIDGGFAVLGLDDIGAEGSGVAQASLEAQGSAVEKPEKVAGAGGAGLEGACE